MFFSDLILFNNSKRKSYNIMFLSYLIISLKNSFTAVSVTIYKQSHTSPNFPNVYNYWNDINGPNDITP